MRLMTGGTAWRSPATERMFLRIALSAVIAGVLSGLLLTVLQAHKVQPLILAAETFEVQAADDHDHGHDDADESGRIMFRLGTNVLVGVGFALLLSAALALTGRRLDWRQGALWGLAGFAIFSLAPALGMPPKLPGMGSGILEEQQAWWLGTVVATGIGLWALLLVPATWLKTIGVVLIVLPHAVGAPEVPAMAGSVPPEMAAAFVSATMVANLVFWLALGALAATTMARLGHSETHPA
jgi:cobalt transporter subunit CbtA